MLPGIVELLGLLDFVAGSNRETIPHEEDGKIYFESRQDVAPIIKAAKEYLSSQVDKNTYRMKDDGKYIPHLNTWLNKGKFYDYE